jgi:hypothetical protein
MCGNRTSRLSRCREREELVGVQGDAARCLGVAFFKLLAMPKLILRLDEATDRSRAIAPGERLLRL